MSFDDGGLYSFKNKILNVLHLENFIIKLTQIMCYKKFKFIHTIKNTL